MDPVGGEMVLVIRVNKKLAKDLVDNVRRSSLEEPAFRVSPIQETSDVFIPILNHPDQIESLLKSSFSDYQGNLDSYVFSVPSSSLVPAKSQPKTSGVEHLRKILRSEFSWTEEQAKEIPEKWIRYGDVIVLFTETLPTGNPDHVLVAFKKSGICPDARCIMTHVGPIEGELRKPKIDLFTPNQSSETIHTENDLKFKFDVKQVMFAPGNGTERIRIAKLKLSSTDETVIDMFTGLGYFTLPLAKFHPQNIGRIIALEKNPVSFGYLKQNVVLNKLEGKIFPINGDNRIIAQEYVGKADRILMGYLPTTKDFIPRALEFANPNKPVIFHYHHLCQKSEYETLAIQDFVECLSSAGLQREVKLLAFCKVKSYAPKIFHCCADIQLSPILPK